MLSIAFTRSAPIFGVLTDSGCVQRTGGGAASISALTNSVNGLMPRSTPPSMLPLNRKSLFSYASASFTSSAAVFCGGGGGGGADGSAGGAPRRPAPRLAGAYSPKSGFFCACSAIIGLRCAGPFVCAGGTAPSNARPHPIPSNRDVMRPSVGRPYSKRFSCGCVTITGTMADEPEESEFRFEKQRTEASVTLTGGESASGSFFVAPARSNHEGAERVGELLNQEPGFFPFEIQTADGPRTILYHRAHVITVTLTDSEAARDPGYAVAKRSDVFILLSDGRKLRGVVRVYRPEGRDRLLDWTRQPEVFRYVDTDEGTILVNAAHIVAVTEELPK